MCFVYSRNLAHVVPKHSTQYVTINLGHVSRAHTLLALEDPLDHKNNYHKNYQNPYNRSSSLR